MEGAHLASIGKQVALTYPAERLGEGPPLPLQWCSRGAPILKKLQLLAEMPGNSNLVSAVAGYARCSWRARTWPASGSRLT